MVSKKSFFSFLIILENLFLAIFPKIILNENNTVKITKNFMIIILKNF